MFFKITASFLQLSSCYLDTNCIESELESLQNKAKRGSMKQQKEKIHQLGSIKGRAFSVSSLKQLLNFWSRFSQSFLNAIMSSQHLFHRKIYNLCCHLQYIAFRFFTLHQFFFVQNLLILGTQSLVMRTGPVARSVQEQNQICC